jgi:hypothetical protein
MIKKKQLCYVHVILFFGCEEEVEKIIEDDYIIIILSPTRTLTIPYLKKWKKQLQYSTDEAHYHCMFKARNCSIRILPSPILV